MALPLHEATEEVSMLWYFHSLWMKPHQPYTLDHGLFYHITDVDMVLSHFEFDKQKLY